MKRLRIDQMSPQAAAQRLLERFGGSFDRAMQFARHRESAVLDRGRSDHWLDIGRALETLQDRASVRPVEKSRDEQAARQEDAARRRRLRNLVADLEVRMRDVCRNIHFYDRAEIDAATTALEAAARRLKRRPREL